MRKIVCLLVMVFSNFVYGVDSSSTPKVNDYYFPSSEEVETFKKKHKCNLIFGTTKQELEKKFGKEAEHWITYDKYSEAHIKADFNSIEHLNHTLEVFGANSFNEIWVDHYTFYFTKWSAEHLEILKELLKDGGSLNYSPEYHVMLGYDEKKLKQALKYKQLLSTNLAVEQEYKDYVQNNSKIVDEEIKNLFESLNSNRYLISGYVGATVFDFDQKESIVQKIQHYTKDYTIGSHTLLLKKIFQKVEVKLDSQYPFKIFANNNERKLEEPLVLIKATKQ